MRNCCSHRVGIFRKINNDIIVQIAYFSFVVMIFVFRSIPQTSQCILYILQVLVTALIDVIVKWLLNILSLLLLLMYLFGVCGVYFFGYKTNEAKDEKHWGSLPTAMLTLFGFVTVSCP